MIYFLTLSIVVSNMQVTSRDEVQGLFSMKVEIECPQEDDIGCPLVANCCTTFGGFRSHGS